MTEALYFKEFTHDWKDAEVEPVEDLFLNPLAEMFDAQRSLMVECGVYELPPDLAFLITANALAAEVAETTEFFNDITKPWKRVKSADIDATKVEIVDQLHFLLQEAMIVGMDWQEMHALYMVKNQTNFRRIRDKLRITNV